MSKILNRELIVEKISWDIILKEKVCFRATLVCKGYIACDYNFEIKREDIDCNQFDKKRDNSFLKECSSDDEELLDHIFNKWEDN
jgi:hypothetical protein